MWRPAFVCAYHSAAQGSNPNHTIYSLSIQSQILYYNLRCFIKPKSCIKTNLAFLITNKILIYMCCWECIELVSLECL